jgi:hypothetical protein
MNNLWDLILIKVRCLHLEEKKVAIDLIEQVIEENIPDQWVELESKI